MNEYSEVEGGPRNVFLVIFLLSSHRLIHPRLPVLSSVLPLIDINDTEQHDLTLFFHL